MRTVENRWEIRIVMLPDSLDEFLAAVV